jgi:hypothetical protein
VNGVKRHELDLTSLVAGVIFVAVGGTFLLDLLVDMALDPRWLAPLVLIGVGLAGLLSAVPMGRSAPADPDGDATVDA